jgi:hypothetical protein
MSILSLLNFSFRLYTPAALGRHPFLSGLGSAVELYSAFIVEEIEADDCKTVIIILVF